MNFEKALKLRELNTGLWLLDGELYKKWKTTASLVWLHGIPGCGKTVLSSTVLENVLDYASNDPGKAVAYFYFDFNDKQKQNTGLMVQSLVSQLSRQCIKMPPSLEALFKHCESGQRQPTLDSLLKVLQELIADFPSTYLVLDALDECEDRRELMNFIKHICPWQANGLHILSTSRREGDIKNTLERILDEKNILCVQTDVIDRDIQLYVQRRLADEESLQKWRADDAIRLRIETSLREKARGIYVLSHYRCMIAKLMFQVSVSGVST